MYALDIARKTEGNIESVNDAEIIEGLLIEPKLDSFERALERSRTLEHLEWQISDVPWNVPTEGD